MSEEETAPETVEPESVAEPETVEAGPPTALLVWNGVAITVPAEIEDCDPDFLEAFENDAAIHALRALLGSDGYDNARAEFKKKHGRRPTVRDINVLAELIAKQYGFESAGE